MGCQRRARRRRTLFAVQPTPNVIVGNRRSDRATRLALLLMSCCPSRSVVGAREMRQVRALRVGRGVCRVARHGNVDALMLLAASAVVSVCPNCAGRWMPSRSCRTAGGLHAIGKGQKTGISDTAPTVVVGRRRSDHTTRSLLLLLSSSLPCNVGGARGMGCARSL